MDDAADNTAVVNPRFAAYIPRQMRLNLPPLLITQPKQVAPHCPRSESAIDSESITDSLSNDFIEFWP
jgi:hypothetical protein